MFACYQGGAYRLLKTGNTIITYGGIATTDGAPTDRNLEAFCTSRIIQVTPQKDVMFDLRIEGWLDPRLHHFPRALVLSTPPGRWTFQLQVVSTPAPPATGP